MKKLLAYLLMVATCYGVGYQVKLSDLNDAEWVEVAPGDYRILWSDIGGVTPPAGLTPVLEYLFEDVGGTNNTVYTLDTSGNDYTGTVITATWNKATNGANNSYTFNGSSDFIFNREIASDRAGTSNYTFSFWAKASSYQANPLNFQITEEPGDANKLLAVYTHDTLNGNGVRIFRNGSTVFDENGADRTGTWNQYTFVGNGTNLEVYVDDTSIGRYAGDVTIHPDSDLFTLGGYSGNFNQFFAGDNTLVGFYTNAFTASEVSITNVPQKNTIGIIPDYLADTPTAQSKTRAVVMCNNIYQDGWTNNVDVDTASAPDLKGTTAIGWGDGDGAANYIYIAETNFTTHIFWAGPNENELTNYATIDGTQYVNGSAQAYANVYYYTELTTNYFWKSDASTFYDGIITAIHLGDYDASDVADFYTKTQGKYE